LGERRETRSIKWTGPNRVEKGKGGREGPSRLKKNFKATSRELGDKGPPRQGGQTTNSSCTLYRKEWAVTSVSTWPRGRLRTSFLETEHDKGGESKHHWGGKEENIEI